MATSDLLTLLSIGLIQLLAVISPGPSFLITARTAVAQSRMDSGKLAQAGFSLSRTSDEAVRLAIRRIIESLPNRPA